MFATHFIPFLIVVVWVSSLRLYQEAMKSAWFKTALSVVAVVFAASANVWASNVINDTFSVSASYFPITQAILTLAYFPVVFLKPFFFAWYAAFVVLGALVFLGLWMTSETPKAAIVRIVYFVMALFFVSASYATVAGLDQRKQQVVMFLASWGDFDFKDRCTNNLGENASGTILLPGSNVLVQRQFVDRDGRIVFGYDVQPCVLVDEGTNSY
jgi:hypothetical protein